MKKLSLIGLASACLLLAACQSSSYQIKGTAKEMRNGDTLYLTTDLSTRIPIDTIIVNDKSFEIAGTTDTTRLSMIYAAHHPEINVSFFMTPGDIRIILRNKGSRVEGPSINNYWQALNDSIESYGIEMKDIAQLVYGDPQISIDLKKKLIDKMSAVDKKIKRKIKEVADQHKDDELGRFINKNFQE